jgi:hypothetical protein
MGTAEEGALSAAARAAWPRTCAYVMVSLCTGVRTEEARALRWEHVDFGDPASILPRPASVRCGGRCAPGGTPRPGPPGARSLFRRSRWPRCRHCTMTRHPRWIWPWPTVFHAGYLRADLLAASSGYRPGGSCRQAESRRGRHRPARGYDQARARIVRPAAYGRRGERRNA